MEGLPPGAILGLGAGLFAALHLALRWPLPLCLLVVAMATGLLGGVGLPFRHLVEGGFGFVTLILTLFAGAFFGEMMGRSGAADAVAAGIFQLGRHRVPAVLALCGLPIFVVGMLVGVAGVAVLAGGVFAAPALRRLGYEDASSAAFIAVIATAGMVAPPVNVPAMMIADGVNMPFSSVTGTLLALALPLAAAGLVWFAWRGPEGVPAAAGARAGWTGLLPLGLMLAIWIAARMFGGTIVDPGSALVLVIGGLAVLPWLPRGGVGPVILATFDGAPLRLAAVLVTVGILVQMLALTGVRGWLVLATVSLPPPWIYPGLAVGLPVLGGVVTASGAAATLGVPAAFAFIGQDMTLNVAALAGLAALAEVLPPTAVAAALAAHVAGGPPLGRVLRRAWPPMLALAIPAVLLLVFAPQIGRLLG